MKLSNVTIADRGNLEKERLHLKVKADTGLGNYIVFATEYTAPTNFSANPKATFWFPAKPVKAGDHVILYTKSGSPSENKNQDGTTNHFFFWGKTAPLFTAAQSCSVVLELTSWEASPFK